MGGTGGGGSGQAADGLSCGTMGTPGTYVLSPQNTLVGLILTSGQWHASGMKIVKIVPAKGICDETVGRDEGETPQ